MTDKKLITLYSKLGLIDSKGNKLVLHKDCPNHEYCWQNLQDRKPENEVFYTITRPWVGENYNELKLLIIAINMNEYGSYDGAIELIEYAKFELGQGKRKMFISATYPGTFLFHRMGSYAAAFAEKSKLIKPIWNANYPSSDDIISAFDYIAYTNHIKCSPIGAKSKPSYQMWEKCGSFILRHEISLLEPSKIMVLGNSDNFYNFNQRVLDNEITLTWKGKVGVGNGLINNKKIEITVAPHPASFGGNSSEIMTDLIDAMKK